MKQPCGYSCVFIRVAALAAALLSVVVPAFAQSAAGGANHTVILKSDGTVWTVGFNGSGQLGDNSQTTRKSPIQVSGLSDVVAVAAGGNNSLAITSTGALYVWGDNTYGQVGDGTSGNIRKTPVQSNLTNIVAIAAGTYHSVALKSNGEVFVWGRDTKGQLGDGTASSTNSTAPVSLTTGVGAIAAGAEFTLIVKTDNTVYGTGENSDYQLGYTNNTDQASLVQMSGVSTATAVAAGERHSIILLSAGTLKGVGYNAYGQLGDGTITTPRSSLVSVANLTNITAIASGGYHVLARESDGTAWAWGRNHVGQIGNDNAGTDATSPVELTSLSSITKVGAGTNHSVAITSDGVVYTWGANTNYQLGDGTDENRHVSTSISAAGFDWKVSTPSFNVNPGTYTIDKTVTISITTTGGKICYTQNGSEPTESDTCVTAASTTASVSTSQTLKAKAFKSGLAPSNTTAAAYELKVVTPTMSPAQGTYSSAQSVTMATTTSGATLRYTTDGNTPTGSSTAYSGAITVGTSTTVKVRGFKSGWTTSDETSKTYTMSFGTLATPTADQAAGTYVNSVAVALSSISGATIRYTTNNSAVQSTSPIYSTALAFDVTTTLRFKAYHPDYSPSAEVSNLYTLAASSPTFNPTAGAYVAGQLVTVTSPSVGSTVHYTINGTEPTESDPAITSGSTLVVGNYTLKAKAWKSGASASATATAAYTITGDVSPPAVSAGYMHSLAIRSDGVAWGWGYNSFGQVGDGTQTQRTLPQMMTGVTGAMAARGGNVHSHVLLNDGTLVGFGSGTNGRLGDGTTSVHLLPSPISLTGIIAVADGGAHAVALKGDGTVYAWGLNGQGQLGDGSTTQRLTPTLITGVSSISAVSAGDEFSVALKQDGTVWAWGRNDEGQIGDDTNTDRTSPVPVDDITTATAISAGYDHAVALLSDGTVASWGANDYGALGDGTITDANAPVAAAGLDDVVAIGAGHRFSVALKDDGTVWTWGYNSEGHLGDGTDTDRWSPAQVSGLSDIAQIAVGSDHVLALSSDGIVYAWGQNDRGQLGDGTTVDRWAPIAISGTGMNWRVATPTLSLASGLYTASQSVTVTIADPNATIRYTTTGIDPTSSDATVTSGGAITIDQSQTLKVSGWKTGAPTSVVVSRAYELKAVTPTLTPASGAYGSTQSVSMSTTTSGATVRYTTDGTEPTSSSSVYSTALSVSMTQTVKARAYKTGWTASDSHHASYWLSEGAVATPTISPSGGTHTTPPLLAITTATSGATIRYTLDGSTPTFTSPVFVYPFLLHMTTTVKATAFKAGYTASAVATTTYGVDASGATATPLIVPAGGTYATGQTVTITGASGATLRYTTDGTDPTTSSTSITSGNTVAVVKSQVLKVRAWASGLDPSAVRRADFMITGAVAAGNLFSMGLDSSGGVWTWGSDGFGQLGNGGGTSQTPVPTAAQVMSGGAAIAAGGATAIAAKADGTLWHWGSGVGNSPTQLSGITDATAVASGGGHVLVLKSDGTVWSYGINTYGQLGDGTTTNRTTPVQVVGLTGVVAIAANQESSYALQTNGGSTGLLWAWGRNQFGQLGDGSTLSRVTPVRVLGVTNPARIASSYSASFAIALQANGQVVAWGSNSEGQLGVGSTTDRTSALPVQTIAAARVIGAGTAHALAVDTVARAWGWGHWARLGTGGISNGSQAPIPSDLGGVLTIAGGDAHTLAVRPDGSVAAFGSNGGRLGNGSTSSTNDIVTVTGLELADNDWLMSDADHDSLVTWREYFSGTDPLNPDTNGNGILDGLDDRTGADALNPDVDGDGVPNWIEQMNGTDPFRADTDGDTVPDGSDVYPLDPTRSMAPSSNPSDTTPPIITLKEPVSAVPVP